MAYIQHRLTAEDIRLLEQPFSGEEIRMETMHLGSLKAPCPYGFQVGFYQKYWHIVGPDVVNFVNNFLMGKEQLTSLNNTFITLIPKVKSPMEPSQFRLISFCTVLYKIITKTLANRMKVILDHLISLNQCAFFKGWLILDNIIFSHEIFYHMRTHQSREHWMTLKIDMSKAYDKVEWAFLITTMQTMGFPPSWCSWVYQCISSPVFQILVN